jgi:hypothetical protein
VTISITGIGGEPTIIGAEEPQDVEDKYGRP